VLNEIKICGYDNDTQKAALITAQNGIGTAASRKAFLDGQRLKNWEKPRPESVKKNERGGVR
jgi:hypothetical protein